MLKQIFILLLLKSTYSALTDEYPHLHLKNGIQCVQTIIDTYYIFNRHGFVIMTKTFNTSHVSDDVINNIFKYLYDTHNTTVMVIGNDEKDLHWRKDGHSVADNEDEHTGADDLGLSMSDDVFIQSHLMFIRFADYYIIIVDGYRMFNSKIRQLVRVPSWNPRARMIIYITINTKNKKRMSMYTMHILRILWSYHVMNVVLLLHDWKDHTIIDVYSWNPYDPPKRCGEKFQNTKKYAERYDRCINGTFEKNANLFPNKVPNNLRKCPLKVLGVIWHPFLNHNRTDKYAGFDRRILDLIAQRLNFTIELDTRIPFWGDRTENGTWDGMLGNLKKGYGEVGIGAIYPDIEVHEDFEPTQSYLQDSFTWVVPRARELPQWTNLIILLQPSMWLASGVTYIVCTVIWYFFAQVPWEKGIRLKEFVPSILETWCINMSESTVFRPSSDSFRIYFLFFVLYSMIWCTVYQTKLITVLTNPTYEKQMKDTNELMQSNLKFGGNEYYRVFFDNSVDEVEDYFYENYIVMSVHRELDDLIKYRNISLLASRLYLRHLNAHTFHFNDAYGVPMFYAFESNVLSFAVEMITIKGFALLEKFNSLLSLFKSSGLVNYLYRRFDTVTKRMTAQVLREANIFDEHEEKLSLDDLQGLFLAVFLGTLLSTIAFVGELIVFNRNRNKIKSSSNKRPNKKIKDNKRKNKVRGYGVRLKNHKKFDLIKNLVKLNNLQVKKSFSKKQI